MIIEDEPGIRADTKALWDRLSARRPCLGSTIREMPGKTTGIAISAASCKGRPLTIPFSDGALLLGTWQQIVVVDFDTRSRTRELIFQIIGE